MQQLPHFYTVDTETAFDGAMKLVATGLPDLVAAPPAEFDGPGDQWSPETLLMASLVACYVLSFRAVARAAKFEWTSIACSATGKLDRVEKVTRFTQVTTKVNLVVPETTDQGKAESLVQRAKHVCLISNSLHAESVVECTVTTGPRSSV